MKGYLAAGVVLCLLAHGRAAVIKGVSGRFGPRSCVSLTRSPEGTCVISTDCEGVDISQTEFAFDCVGKTIMRHSFGVGGFDVDEEFDTGLKCDQCSVDAPPVHHEVARVKPVHHEVVPAEPVAKPTPTVAKVAKPPKVIHAKPVNPVKPLKLNAKAKRDSSTQEPVEPAGAKAATVIKARPKTHTSSKIIWGSSTKDHKTKEQHAKLIPRVEIATPVKYGPNGCVSVYKSAGDHCIMSTNCRSSDMSNYEYGLVCVDQVGSPVKHLFGKDSFDPVETFDTLIKCNECLGLEDVPDGVALAGEIAALGKDISGLKDAMVNISLNVGLLNNQVFPSMAPAPAPAASAPIEELPAPTQLPAPPADPTKLLLESAAHSRHSRKQHLRHSNSRFNRHRPHRKHVQEDDDDAEELDNW